MLLNTLSSLPWCLWLTADTAKDHADYQQRDRAKLSAPSIDIGSIPVQCGSSTLIGQMGGSASGTGRRRKGSDVDFDKDVGKRMKESSG